VRVLLQSEKINIKEIYKGYKPFEATVNLGNVRTVREFIRSRKLTDEDINKAKTQLCLKMI